MTQATIRIPTPLRTYTDGADQVVVEGATVGEILCRLGETHEGLLDRILDGEGRVRSFVNVYVGSDDVRSRGGLDTPLSEGDVVSIVPAVAGGAPPRRPATPPGGPNA